MEKEVDVLTLCKRLIELTKQEKCAWKETSETNRYKLMLKNGAVEVYHFNPSQFDIMNKSYYEVSLYDKGQYCYATYKGTSEAEEYNKTFRELYILVMKYMETIRRRKIAQLFEELDDETSG